MTADLLTWPAPERNKAPILEVLRRVLPVQGRVLEVASGTGQHIVHFAAALPALQWLPSDPDAALCAAIEARVAAAKLDNIAPPLLLDVCDRPWSVERPDAIVCINLIHIAPWPAALALLGEAGHLLPTDGVLYLYGPYQRGGRHTAPSNEAFDAELRGRDPRWGVRGIEDVQGEALRQGLVLEEIIAMPANNFSLVLRRR